MYSSTVNVTKVICWFTEKEGQLCDPVNIKQNSYTSVVPDKLDINQFFKNKLCTTFSPREETINYDVNIYILQALIYK